MATPIADAARGRRDGVLRRPRGLRRRRRHAASRWVGGRCRRSRPSAVLAVTTQHMCGMGGDLFALVHRPDGPPDALCAAGRAGTGSDPVALRAEGHRSMPFRGDVRSAPVPGCVDGWCALHERHGRLPLATVLEPARRAAEDGFAASPLLAMATALVADVAGADDFLPDGRPGGRRAGPSAGRRRRPCAPSDTAADRRSTRAPSAMPSSRSATVCTSAPTSRGRRPTGSRRSRSRHGAIASGRSRRRRRATWR